VVALGVLATGALSIAVTLAASDADNWPGWLRPYHRWGWWSVLVLLVTAAALAVWQAIRQPTTPAGSTTAHAADSGPVAGHDLTITGAQGQTAGRDARTVSGGAAPTAGGDLHITTITTTGPVSAPTGAAGPVNPAGPVANLPPRNLAFTGRGDLLDRLHQQLTTPTVGAVAVTALPSHPPDQSPGKDNDVGAPQVLHGLGGVGKTQLAAEYAHQHAADYQIRWWIPADQPAAIPGRLLALAHRLGIPELTDQAETIATLLDELGRSDRWLLVFDNAEEPRDLRPYWPATQSGGRVIVTSRNAYWQPFAASVPVGVLPRPDAIAFLQRRAGLDHDHADALAEALGDLPLALEQAAAYLEATSTRPAEYLSLLRERAAELFTLGQPFNYEETIATTWSVSLERVRQQTPVSEDLLQLCSFLAPDDIPRSIFVDHPGVLPARLQAAIRDQISYQQALGTLTRYSLITATADSVSVHRLVQAVIRSGLDDHARRDWAQSAVELVLAALPDQSNDVNAWPTLARLLPHGLVAAEHAAALNTKPKATTTLLSAAAGYLWSRGQSQQARPLVEQALAIDEARLGPRHPRVASTLDKLGIVLDALGDLAGARAAHKRAITIYEDTYGPESLGVARALDNLGGVLSSLGHLPEARAAHERGLSIFRVKFGSDHPEVAHALHNLANVVHAQGDLNSARTLHQRALTIRETRLGPDHPDTAQSLNNLAIVLADQGDLDQARTLHQRALTIRETRLGPDHPLTAHSLNNLATVLADQGDLDQARTLHQRALTIYETCLGPDHPDTVRSRVDLAAVAAALENGE